MMKQKPAISEPSNTQVNDVIFNDADHDDDRVIGHIVPQINGSKMCGVGSVLFDVVWTGRCSERLMRFAEFIAIAISVR